LERKPDPYCTTDRFSAQTGMRITKLGPDYAEAQMLVEDHHLNGLDILHGGVYFALADFAFGAATGYIANPLVTLNASIEFISSARSGDTLIATSEDVASSRRIARHQIEIRNQDSELVARIQCTGYRKEPST
jgi:acyl-CoA thioesterase